jgi:hypothetical protein
VDDVDAGHELEQFAGKMTGAAVAAGVLGHEDVPVARARQGAVAERVGNSR